MDCEIRNDTASTSCGESLQGFLMKFCNVSVCLPHVQRYVALVNERSDHHPDTHCFGTRVNTLAWDTALIAAFMSQQWGVVTTYSIERAVVRLIFANLSHGVREGFGY